RGDSFRSNLSGTMDGFADPQIGSTTAQVRDFVLDVGVGGPALLRQQRGGSHDLTGLAIPACRDTVFDPRGLERMVPAQPFDGCDRLAFCFIGGQGAGPDGPAAHMYRACSAKPGAASVLCSSQPDRVAQHPE